MKSAEIESHRHDMSFSQFELSQVQKLLEEKEKQLNEKDKQLIQATYQNTGLDKQLNEVRTSFNRAESKLNQYEREFAKSITQLDQARSGFESDRAKLQAGKDKEMEEQLLKMKRMWQDHEASVQQDIRVLCKQHAIVYADKVPFKGTPDNALEFSGQYHIFDAKSPGTDDLSNFPLYIKAQTKLAKKYASQEAVQKDIYFVVPTNAISVIKELTYNCGEYTVYVITRDSLEPIMLSLLKIQEYEFAKQLSPSEMDSIARVIGRFSHLFKRKIQVRGRSGG
jgi:hypothetical protein